MRESFEEIYQRYDNFCRKNIRNEQDLLNFEKINLIKERLFNNKQPDKFYRVKGQPFIKDMKLFGKDVIIPVGEIDVGKTYWSQIFLRDHPQFEYFSYSRTYDLIDMQRTEKYDKIIAGPFTHQSERKCTEMLEEFVQTTNGQIIIDGYLMNLPFRAALFKYLKQYDFKIHVVYFSMEYLVRHFYENACKAVVKSVLYERYIKSFKKRYIKEGRIDELFDIEDHIIELVSKRRRMSSEEIYMKYLNDPEVKERLSDEINALTRSIYNYHDYGQESRIMYYGSDIFYWIHE